MKTHMTKRLWKYLCKHKWCLLLTLIFALISSGILMIAPTLSGRAIDKIVSKGHVDFSAVFSIITILAFIYIVSAFFQWFVSYLTNKLAYGTVRDMRKDAFDSIGHLPLKFFDSKSHGDIISRLTNDIDAVSDGLLQGITQLFTGIVTIVGSFVFMMLLNPFITFIVVAITPIAFLIAGVIAKKSNKYFKQQQETVGELDGHVEEFIGNQKIVKALGSEEDTFEKFSEINSRLYTCGQKAQFASSLVNPTTRLINNTAYVCVGIVGAILTIRGSITVGVISSFLIYATQFAKPINEITSVATQIQTAFAAAKRIFEIIDEKPESAEPDDMPEFRDVQGNVSFKNVSFSYRKDQKLISGLNLEVKQDNIIAIVGPTGAGKTTLVNLLMRFYDVDGGEILIDGRNINSVKRDSLRTSFAMVLQDTWIFSGTVKENIAYGKQGATDEEIIEAAKKAHAHSFIKKLPKGYDTEISEENGDLSQGQKQLLTIARAMLLDPPMLILDEATSSVDTRTEQRIHKAFSTMMKGKTSFVIAHRLSTIVDADLILVMNNGSVIEHGTHEQLLKKHGFYYKLYNSQFAPKEALT